MSQLLYSITEPQTLLSIFAAIAVFATCISLAMPVFQKDELNSRMKSVAIERDKLRARERARLAEQEKKSSLKSQTEEGFIQTIVDNLNLKSSIADEGTTDKLLMAGMRKSSHLTVFVFFKVAMPFIMMALGAFLIFVTFAGERSAIINIAVIGFFGVVGFYLPGVYIQNVITKRQLSMKRGWPDSLDLMLICVESGMSLEATLKKVAIEIGLQSPELAEELTLTTAELSYLQERRTAHENLAKRTGLESVKAVTMALIQAERYGTPLSTALRSLAQESREMRMAEAEKKAAALPPKLTVPMIVFFLPVLFGVILGPAIIQISEKF